MHRILLELPFMFSFVPDRWSATVQVMLEKDPGRPWVHRFRIIELFDAQVNAGFQIFIGRRMIYNAVDRSLLHDASYGSTPGRTCQEACIQRTLMMDMMRLMRKVGGLFDCDATGCYDRILPAFQSLHTRRMGLSKEISTFVAKLMFKCRRYVKTKYGVSDEYIQSTVDEVLYGIGQGNGGGPGMWVSQLTVMFQVVQKIAVGIKFKAPTLEEVYETVGLGFVDDVALGTSIEDEAVVHQIDQATEATKDMAQKWEILLHTNGGKLELSKCFWIIFAWGWRGGKPKLKKKQEIWTEMKIRQSSDGKKIVIPLKDVDKAPKRLGVRMAANGLWTKEIKRWQHTAILFARKVQRAKFSRMAGWKTYSMIWAAKFRYVAGTIGMTRKECDDLQKPVVRECLRASGFCSTFPRWVVFGPTDLGGLEWDNAHSLKCIEQIKVIFGHFRMESHLGMLMKIELMTVNLMAGLTDCILQQSERVEYLEPSWFRSLHYSLVAIGGTIDTFGIWQQNKQREGDEFIMEVARNTGRSEEEMLSLNLCRIYLRCITLADIYNYEGTRIRMDIISCKKQQKSKLQWPRQKKPTVAMRERRKVFLLELVDEKGFAITKLGKWIFGTMNLYWDVEYNDEQDLVVTRKYNEVYTHKLKNGRSYEGRGELNNSELKTVPVRAIKSSIGIIVNRVIKRPEQVKAGSLTEILESKKDYIRNTIGVLLINQEKLEQLRKKWDEGVNIIIATDGGLGDDIGSSGAAWVFEGEEHSIMRHYTAEESIFQTMESTREELLAMLAVEFILDAMAELWGVPELGLRILIVDRQ